MNNRVILGLQWGDEGKGKIVDLLSEDFDIIARCQGGANAGHTVWVNGQKFILRLIPSGVLHPDKICVIGNGVVVDVFQLLAEIRELEERGINTSGRVLVSGRAHMVMPYHKIVEAAEERARGNLAINTSRRGIGPAYMDKIDRCGLQMVDLFDDAILLEKIKYNLETKEHIFETFPKDQKPSHELTFEALIKVRNQVKPLITDVSRYLYEATAAGKKILFEGAQGTLLDVDFGTYPYITSSNTTIGGVLTGLGISPKKLGRITGVVKAYQTRVGNGPFPTELTDSLGEKIRELGAEYGSVTGRPRRCGWLDLVLLKYAVQINGVDDLAIMKLDILDALDEIKVCVAYRLNGQVTDTPPQSIAHLHEIEPVYETLPGWRKPSHEVKRFNDLDAGTIAYLRFIEDYLGLKTALISTGCDREETITLW